MKTLTTKELLANAFIESCQKVSFDKISIADIVTPLGLNRNTFYYHFVDRSELIQWIYRRDIALQLKKLTELKNLIYLNEEKGVCSEFPYYVFIKSGIRSIDNSPFFSAFNACLQNRRKYYANIFSGEERSSFESYLYALYLPALTKDIEFILSKRYLNQEDLSFLAEFYTGAFLSYFKRRLYDKKATDYTTGMGSFGNIIHSSLEQEIREQQLSRRL